MGDHHERVARIMQECGLQAQRKAKRRTTTDSTHDFPHYANLVAELEIVHPEHIWVSDITYIRLGEGFVYQVVLMDVFTCGFRGWHLGHFLDQILTLRALDQPLASTHVGDSSFRPGGCRMPRPPTPHACKPEESRSAWSKWELPGKMAMRNG